MVSSGVAAYNDAAGRNETVEKYGYLVKRIAHHLLARLPDSVQIDDLLQAGMLGLLEEFDIPQLTARVASRGVDMLDGK